MSQLASLKAATSLGDLAVLLNYKPKKLAYILYGKPIAMRYTDFNIPKKSGGVRRISAPDSRLKLVQRRIADLLQNCLDEINALGGWADSQGRMQDRISHGFKRGRSIVTNAMQHRSRRHVLNLDLQDFFPSINFGRIRGVLQNDTHFKLDRDVAQAIAHAACLEGKLPQGSPCSPVLSNMVARILDVRLARLAVRYRCSYTRYADDLTISTSQELFPVELAELAPSGQWLPGPKLLKCIESSGFVIHPSKTRLTRSTSRQTVTGLVVNRKVNVTTDIRKRSRAMVHKLVTSGVFDEKDPVTRVIAPGSVERLRGILGFVHSIDVYSHSRVPEDRRGSLHAKENPYRRFLLYTQFYSRNSPLLVCEGKTDNVYLVHAIRQRAALFPNLARSGSGGPEILVNRFKYSGSTTQLILGLNGGSPSLGSFCQLYKRESAKFFGASDNPVIVVVDNDQGGKDFWNKVKHLTDAKHYPAAEPFIRLFGNLYVCLTPLKGAKESQIEDFFDSKTLGTPHEGKTFSKADPVDKAKHFGKSVFAHKVIAPEADTIDFSGFDQLLENISAALDDYATRSNPWGHS